MLQKFQENLAKGRSEDREDERDQYFGLSLRELVHQFKWQILVLFKCLMLQPKVRSSDSKTACPSVADIDQILFFGSHCERVCQVQFSLISLIPGLVRNLQDCSDPQMNRYAETLKKPDSVRTSDRASLLGYMGVPLQIFGKGSVFGPYTPLQSLDILTDMDTKSYVVGSTNSLLIQQKDRYCDVLVDLDENTVSVLTPSLRPAIALSVADRRWIDFVTQQVNDTWDDADPSRPKTHGYAGSEEFIRLQFEEYLLALLSAAKYHQYLGSHSADDPKALLADVEGDPSSEFSAVFLDAWRETENYKLWNRTTDSHLFDIVEPRHPMAGGLTMDDVQRRLAAQVAELHLDERFSQTREVVNKRLADGRTQVTSAFNKVWSDIETMREVQRKRSEEARAGLGSSSPTSSAHEKIPFASNGKPPRPDHLHQAQASVTAAGQRASAYLSSWGSWVGEKRRAGWGRSYSGSAGNGPTTPPVPCNERAKVTTVSELEKEKVDGVANSDSTSQERPSSHDIDRIDGKEAG